MKKGKRFLGSLIILILLFVNHVRCKGQAAHIYTLYETPEMYMPLPDTAHSGKIDCYASLTGTGTNISFAPTRHFLFMASVYGDYVDYDQWYDNPDIMSKVNFLLMDAGAGYHGKIGKSGTFEFLAGTGFANADVTNGGYLSYNNAAGQFFHSFLQTDIGTCSQYGEVGIGCRLSNQYGFSNYYQITNNQNGGVQSEYLEHLSGDALFLQPSGYAAIGSKHVKVKISIGFSNKLFGPDIPGSYGSLYQDINFEVGLAVNW